MALIIEGRDAARCQSLLNIMREYPQQATRRNGRPGVAYTLRAVALDADGELEISTKVADLLDVATRSARLTEAEKVELVDIEAAAVTRVS